MNNRRYTPDYWAEIMAKHILSEMFKVFDAQEQEHGPDMAQLICLKVLTKYVGAIAYNTMQDRPDDTMTNKELGTYVIENFAAMKTRVQEAIATGFQDAMYTHAGKTVDYYCQVTAVGDPINKYPI